MKFTVFDIESDGLLKTATRMHCLSYAIVDDGVIIEKGSLTRKAEVIEFMSKQETIVGHNIIRFDIPLTEKLTGVKKDYFAIDTLALSWYLHPLPGFGHSLEKWGERLGAKKPEIEDWKTLSKEVYIERCEADVVINVKLINYQLEYLKEIYRHEDDLERLIRYLGFKMECLADQEIRGIPLDRRLAEESKLNLEFLIDEKISILRDKMPLKLGTVRKNKPKVMYKKDESLSHYGEAWLAELKRAGLPTETEVLRNPPNPASHQQMKQWLSELGWVPMTFKESTSKTKKSGQMIPQMSLPYGAGLCPSVIALFEEHPFLEALDGLYKARHREGIFNAFLEEVDDKGKIYSTAHGFTNTLRLQHSRPIVNLPAPSRLYGKEIRGCLTVPNDDYVMVGADLSGLEDKTKQHFIYFYDPKYVADMQVEGFDPHLDIGVLANLLTEEESEFYKKYDSETATDKEKQRHESIKRRRFKAKTTNFSATYGAGPPKIADTLRCSLSEANKLFRTYWKRNRAVKQIANACRVKKVRGQKWLFNPVSSFWLFLKTDKDRFSTLNQNTGVYVFDAWISNVRKRLKPLGILILLQYHDELMLICRKSKLNLVVAHLHQAMVEVNKELELNIMIYNSVDTGKNYAECH